MVKEIWRYRDEYFDALYNAVRLRYQLVPYIYTMARETYETGVSLCRPMYYDYPEDERAYTYSRQYMFGDNILVAPIGAPMENGVSDVKVWLPAGNDWYEAYGHVIERRTGTYPTIFYRRISYLC